MKTKNISRKQNSSLFDIYASNLSFYVPKYKDNFACPICLTVFSREAIQEKKVSLEHIVPSSIGGKLLTLTCKKCNNDAGTKLDAHFAKKVRGEDILAGKSEHPISGRIEIGDGEFGADIYFSESNNPNVKIIGVEDRSNPELQAKAQTAMDMGTPEINLKWNLGYRRNRSSVAVLRMGYLLMFRHFGYGYILHNNLVQVRNQIREPENETNILKGLLELDKPPVSNTVVIITTPQRLQSFMAILNISTNTQRYVGVLLPGMSDDSFEIYDYLASYSKKDFKEIKPTYYFTDYNQNFVEQSQYKGFPYFLWEKFSSQDIKKSARP